MSSSVHSGLVLVCLMVLPFLLAQAHVLPSMRRPYGPGPITPPCCFTVSNATINQQVNKCYEQKKTFAPCKIHAYMFVTVHNTSCVDPRAWWVPQRLERLKERGITCQILGQ